MEQLECDCFERPLTWRRVASSVGRWVGEHLFPSRPPEHLLPPLPEPPERELSPELKEILANFVADIEKYRGHEDI